jgi:hypothetical protein
LCYQLEGLLLGFIAVEPLRHIPKNSAIEMAGLRIKVAIWFADLLHAIVI